MVARFGWVFIISFKDFFSYIIREQPFNLKGGGGLWFFSKKNILIPNVAEKNILILVEKKKIMWFRVFVI